MNRRPDLEPISSEELDRIREEAQRRSGGVFDRKSERSWESFLGRRRAAAPELTTDQEER